MRTIGDYDPPHVSSSSKAATQPKSCRSGDIEPSEGDIEQYSPSSSGHAENESAANERRGSRLTLLREPVGVQRPPPCEPAIRERGSRPIAAVVAARIDIPDLAACPHRARKLALHARRGSLVDLVCDFDMRGLRTVHLLEAAHHVGDLALEHVDDGVVPEVRVRPVQHEEVGEVRDHDAEVRLGARRPGVAQTLPAPPPAITTRRTGFSSRRISAMNCRMSSLAARKKTSSPSSMTVSPSGCSSSS